MPICHVNNALDTKFNRNQESNTMTYSKTARGERITSTRVFKELCDHGLSNQFDLCMAELHHDAHGLYSAGAVMRWLGY